MRKKEIHLHQNEEKRVRRRLEVLELNKVRRTFSLSLSLSLIKIYEESDKTFVTKNRKKANESETV